MDDGPRLRVRESPIGGSRIAFSYLGSVLAAVVAGLLAVMASPLAASVCRASEDATCLLGWTYGSAILAFALAFAALAWVLRLGWEWWVVVAGVLLGSPWWADALPPGAAIVVGMATPAVAALATLTGRRRPAWRPWAIGACAAALAAAGVAAVVL